MWQLVRRMFGTEADCPRQLYSSTPDCSSAIKKRKAGLHPRSPLWPDPPLACPLRCTAWLAHPAPAATAAGRRASASRASCAAEVPPGGSPPSHCLHAPPRQALARRRQRGPPLQPQRALTRARGACGPDAAVALRVPLLGSPVHPKHTTEARHTIPLLAWQLVRIVVEGALTVSWCGSAPGRAARTSSSTRGICTAESAHLATRTP